ncbi:protein furry [Anaeramoeba ignava]|uniref:Protein furry n=1 Tax=Anaeramoeba ignava TaxID=1746090 RepID=A0A9Q0LMG0_ANAIG|nr:protein furry [Anaeramoeba ignava]
MANHQKLISRDILKESMLSFCSEAHKLIDLNFSNFSNKIIDIPQVLKTQSFLLRLQPLSLLAKHDMTFTVFNLIEWRKKELEIDSTTKELTEKSSKKKSETKEMRLWTNSKKLFIDSIFAKSIQIIINQNSTYLTTEYLQDILQFSVSYIIETYEIFGTQWSHDQTIINKRFLRKLSIQILEQLCITDLDLIDSYFSLNFEIKENKIEVWIHSLGYLKLPFNSEQNAKKSLKFLQKYIDKFSQKKKNKYYINQIMAISKILYKIPNTEILELKQELSQMLTLAFVNSKKIFTKSKEEESLTNFLTQIAVFSDEIFNNHYEELLEKAIDLRNNKKTMKTGIKCLVDLGSKIISSSSDRLSAQNKIKQIIASLFHYSKPYQFNQIRDFKILDYFLKTYAKFDPNFVLENIILSLLRSEMIEKRYIGTQALYSFLRLLSSQNQNDQLTLLNSQDLFKPILPEIEKILLNYISLYGNLLSYSQTKELSDLIKENQIIETRILRNCIRCVSEILPQNIFSIISQLTLHLDGKISRSSITKLKKLLNNPDFQILLIYVYAQNLIRIPIILPEILKGLNILEVLIDEWIFIIKESKKKTGISPQLKIPSQSLISLHKDLLGEKVNVSLSDIDSSLLFFAAYPYPPIRKKTFQLLQKMDSIFQFISNPNEASSSLSQFKKFFPEIIPKCIYRTTEILSVNQLTQKTSEISITFESLFTSDDSSQTLLFLNCFSQLLPKLELDNDQFSSLFYHFFKQITTLENELNSKYQSKFNTQDSMKKIDLWHSFVSCACSIAIYDCISDDQIIELYDKVIPFSTHKKKELGLMTRNALANSNFESASLMFEKLKEHFKAIFIQSDISTKKKQIPLVNQILEIYRLFLEIHRLTPMDNDNPLIEEFSSIIMITKDYFSETADQFSLTILRLRYNYILIIQYFLDFFIKIGDNFTKSERKSFFVILKQFTGIDSRSEIPDPQSFISGFLKAEKLNQQNQEKKQNALIEQIKSINYIALKAITLLFQGEIFDSGTWRSDSQTFRWIFDLVKSQENHEFTSLFVNDILKTFYKSKSEKLFDIFYTQIYLIDENISNAFTIAFVESLLENDIEISPLFLINIILFKLNHPNPLIRQLVTSLFLKYSNKLGLKEFPKTKISSQFVTTKSKISEFQTEISDWIATQKPEMIYEIFELSFENYENLDKKTEDTSLSFQRNLREKESILNYLIPWGKQLKYNKDDEDSRLKFISLLDKLLEHTNKDLDNLTDLYDELWNSISLNDPNLDAIIDYLVGIGMGDPNTELIHTGKKIIYWITKKTGLKSFNILLSLIKFQEYHNPKIIPYKNDMIKSFIKRKFNRRRAVFRKMNESVMSSSLLFFEMGEEETKFINRKQVSLIFLCELITINVEMFYENLPLIFHVVFLELDSFVPIVLYHAKLLLVYLISYIQIENSKDLQSEETQQAFELIKEIQTQDFDMKTDEGLKRVIDLLISLFQGCANGLRNFWLDEAFKWTTQIQMYDQSNPHCISSQYFIRSHHLYRILITQVKNRDTEQIVNVLFRFLCSKSLKIKPFVNEVIETMKKISSKVVVVRNHQKLFWSSVALLNSNNVELFNYGLEILEILLKKGISGFRTLQALITTKPKDWGNSFLGIQQLVLKAFHFENLNETVFSVLSYLTLLKSDEIIENSETSLTSNIVGLLPFFCKNIHKEDENKIKWAQNIANVSQDLGFTEISEVFDQYSKGEFANMNLFLIQLRNSLTNNLLPQVNTCLLNFYLHSNYPVSEYRDEMLTIIYHLISKSEIEKEETKPNLFINLIQFTNPQNLELTKNILDLSIGENYIGKELYIERQEEIEKENVQKIEENFGNIYSSLIVLKQITNLVLDLSNLELSESPISKFENEKTKEIEYQPRFLENDFDESNQSDVEEDIIDIEDEQQEIEEQLKKQQQQKQQQQIEEIENNENNEEIEKQQQKMKILKIMKILKKLKILKILNKMNNNKSKKLKIMKILKKLKNNNKLKKMKILKKKILKLKKLKNNNKLKKMKILSKLKILNNNKSKKIEDIEQKQQIEDIKQHQIEELKIKQEEEDELRRKQEEEDELRRKQEEDDELRRKQEEEDELRRKQQEEDDELRRKQEEEDELRRKQEEEDELRRKQEEEDELRRKQEEEDELRRKQEEEDELRRKQEEEDELRRKQQEEDELRRKKEEEDELRRKQQEEDELRRKQQEEDELRRKQQEEDELRRKQEEEEEQKEIEANKEILDENLFELLDYIPISFLKPEQELKNQLLKRKTKFRKLDIHIKRTRKQWIRSLKTQKITERIAHLKIIMDALALLDGLISLYNNLLEKSQLMVQFNVVEKILHTPILTPQIYEEISYIPLFDNLKSDSCIKLKPTLKELSNQQFDDFVQKKFDMIDKFNKEHENFIKIQNQIEEQHKILETNLTFEESKVVEIKLTSLFYPFQLALFNLFRNYIHLNHEMITILNLTEEVPLQDLEKICASFSENLTYLHWVILKLKRDHLKKD